MCLDLHSYPKLWVQMLVVHILADVYFFLLKFVRKTGAIHLKHGQKPSNGRTQQFLPGHAIMGRACQFRQFFLKRTEIMEAGKNPGYQSPNMEKCCSILFLLFSMFSSIDESHSQVRFFLPLFSDSGDHHRWRGGGRQVRGEVEGTQRGREGKKEGGDASGVKRSWEIPWRMVIRGALRTKNDDLVRDV